PSCTATATPNVTYPLSLHDALPISASSDMPRTTFHIEGLKEIGDDLAELPKAVRREVLVKVLTEQGEPIRAEGERLAPRLTGRLDRKSTRLNSSHQIISYAVFCLKK